MMNVENVQIIHRLWISRNYADLLTPPDYHINTLLLQPLPFKFWCKKLTNTSLGLSSASLTNTDLSAEKEVTRLLVVPGTSCCLPSCEIISCWLLPSSNTGTEEKLGLLSLGNPINFCGAVFTCLAIFNSLQNSNINIGWVVLLPLSWTEKKCHALVMYRYMLLKD